MTELQELIKQRREIDKKIKALKNSKHGRVWVTTTTGIKKIGNKRLKEWKMTIGNKENDRNATMAITNDVNDIIIYISELIDDLQNTLLDIEKKGGEK